MPDQPRLIATQSAGPQRDEAERAAYRERLREYLRDPEFRATEGFPTGTDEAILALSDPPYYTACPNPFLPEILARWREERAEIRARLGLPDDSAEGAYQREPFAADVSEGKNDPIYNAHSYHTKVPHKAIMRYVLHYTDPGDVVFDGFCGTGMTGVAAQLCGDRAAVEGLGYRVDAEGRVFDGERQVSLLGARKAALVDLSPAATFIAYNYNTPVDVEAFERESRRILAEVEAECGWMYETWHPNCDAPNRVKGRINYTVWSDVFLCPSCGGEIVFLNEAYDQATQTVRDEFHCPHCQAQQTKRSLVRNFVTIFDPVLGKSVQQLKRRPVLIEYTVGRTKHTKRVDESDLNLLRRIESLPAASVPADELPIAQMVHGSRLAPKGVTHLHHLFMTRASRAISAIWNRLGVVKDKRIRSFLLFAVDQSIWTMSVLNRYRPTGYSQVNQYLTGVYYIPSQISEISPFYFLEGKVHRLARSGFFDSSARCPSLVSTASAATTIENTNCTDYIFTDPPFGENIPYADLNYIVESWYQVKTNVNCEATVDLFKNRKLTDYQHLMKESFDAYFNSLKHGRWITVEFHNSQNAVWNSIQEALVSAGFVVADVRTLDKQQGSYRQVTAASAAKQDLVITAYKPTSRLEHEFQRDGGTSDGAWAFVREHLEHAPGVVIEKSMLQPVAERQDFLLFDRMVAFHIQRGATVPLSAAEFYAGLRQRFAERDGMFFLPDQVPEYDRARLEAGGPEQLALFVNDEKSTIQWLRRQLDPTVGGRPQTYQDLLPLFLRELHQARHEKLPELSEVLEQNFLKDERDHWFVPDPANAGHLEQVRRRALLREFAAYGQGRGRLKQFRTEAVRAGFADAYQRRDFATTLRVAERLPASVLQEDPELLMYYDTASLRADGR